MYLILTLGVLAFVLSLVLTPLVRDTFRRLGVVDHPDKIRKYHKHPIPRVGGIAIAVSYLAAVGIGMLLPFSYSTTVAKFLPQAWKLMPAVAIVFAIGLLDDLRGLRPSQKLIGQLVAAMVAYWAGVHIDLLAGHPLSIWLSFPLTVIWLVGCTNALNLIDGLDGLAAGVGLFATITMLLAALLHQNLYLVLVTMPLVGCLLGFLRYNFNPASIFLGDCGSLMIGFLLGVFGALSSQKSATLLGMTAPLMAVAIPLLDTGLSVLRRFLRHQPIFGADRGHIHHRLLDRGLTPRQVALLMYGICSFAAMLSLVQSAVQNRFGGLIIVLFVTAAWIGIQNLGYAEFGVARQMIFKGTFRRIIDAQTRLQQFEAALAGADTRHGLWETLVAGGRDFGFRSVRAYMQGQVMEEQLTAPDNEICWQLRIPLSDGQYVNLQRDFKSEVSPMVIGGLVRVIEGAVGSKLKEFRSGSDLQHPWPAEAPHADRSPARVTVPAMRAMAAAASGADNQTFKASA
jgi:UDP-GlcNAc:undecaprenyl-phosphate/decaprenyl-phosphate GlcNAc-1-phosphate transferase